MAVVKGKKCLCKTSLQDWNPERVNGPWFYERYQEFVKVFAKIPGVEFEKCFAQPVLNEETQSIEWFSSLGTNVCTLDQTPNAKIEAEKNRITESIKTTAQTMSENDRKYLNPVLKTLLSDDVNKIIYYSDDQLVFGVWGMSMKKGKVISDVIIDDVKDHSIYHITFNVEGNGTLSFNDIVRKRGHVLGASDIPSYTADEGYIAKEWKPDSPYGVEVNRTLSYTMCFEKDPKDTSSSVDDVGQTTDPIEPTPTPEVPTPEEEYTVTFVTDDRGTLQGTLEYHKKKNEHVLHSEIPTIVPKDGYRFVGWDQNPVDYAVTEDIVFTAQYEPVADVADRVFWRKPWGCLSGCLSWLLALLLLALIGLLLWFLLADHNINFCGNDCNCEVVIPNDSIGPDDPNKPQPILKSCDEQFHQGSNNPESYLINLGQEGGYFEFEYCTGGQIPDRIIIYDGDSRSNHVVFDYYGVTGNDIVINEKIAFTKESILVDIIPNEDSGTYWSILVHCPN